MNYETHTCYFVVCVLQIAIAMKNSKLTTEAGKNIVTTKVHRSKTFWGRQIKAYEAKHGAGILTAHRMLELAIEATKVPPLLSPMKDFKPKLKGTFSPVCYMCLPT